MVCPDLEQLDECLAGAMSDEDRASIEAHVETCARCSARVQEIRANLNVVPRVATIVRTGRRTGETQPAAGPSPSDDSRFANRLGPSRGDTTPDWIGSYRIVREIGHGGMGVVYEAEQENPRRGVALKLLRFDAATPELRRRFEHESAMLARLNHPSIAQIYEASTFETQEGPRSFFAMELVDGVPLTRFAESAGLGARQRLELMAQVCDGVHYAHLQGVIHRDLKPANVLIAPVGGTDRRVGPDRAPSDRTGTFAHPKILDFGIARWIDADPRATTQFTGVGKIIGTIPYMSPEQVSGDSSELDVRSDVYALGVMTYELLTGRLPYSLDDRSLPEAARVIREQTPTPIGEIDRTLRGDVETIVAKALEKEKERRYQSAAELAADIRRYLNHEPIVARPASAIYQLSRFARRHRGLLAGAAVAAVVMIVATVVSTWLAARAIRAEGLAADRLKDAVAAQARAEERAEAARREATKFKAALEFIDDTLASADPYRSPGAKEVSLGEALARASDSLTSGALSEQPEVEMSVRTMIGNTLRSAGDYESAEAHLKRAVEIGERLTPGGSEELALALNKLARTWESQARFPEAEEAYRRALEMRQSIHGEAHIEIAKLKSNLGWLRHQRGDLVEAESLQREALAMRRRLLGESHTEVATSLNNLAITLQALGNAAEAERLFRESLEMDQRLRGEDHPNIADTMTNLALALKDLNRMEEGETLMREAVKKRGALLAPDHPAVATGLNNLALFVFRRGAFDEAEALYRESIELTRAALGSNHPTLAMTFCNLAAVHEQQGEFVDAEALFRQAIEIQRETYGVSNITTVGTGFQLAVLLMKQNKLEEAEPLLAAAVIGARGSLPAGHWKIGLFLRYQGELLMRLERLDESEAILKEAHEIMSTAFGAEHPGAARAAELLEEVRIKSLKQEAAAIEP